MGWGSDIFVKSSRSIRAPFLPLPDVGPPASLLVTRDANVHIPVIGGLGYLKFLAPPEKALRWVEGKFNLLERFPHYVSVDQKTYGRFGVLPSSSATSGSGQRLGGPQE